MHSASVPTCLGIGSRPTNLLLYSDQGEFFPGRFDTSGSMIPHLVPEIEGGYPERDGGAEEEEEEEGQGWGDSRRLMYLTTEWPQNGQ